MKLDGLVTREQTVMMYKPTQELFYEDGMDSGGRTYLSLVGTGTPAMFGRRRAKVKPAFQRIVFAIPYESIPMEDRQYTPPSNGLQEMSTEQNMRFVNKYIEVVKVTVTIAQQENTQ